MISCACEVLVEGHVGSEGNDAEADDGEVLSSHDGLLERLRVIDTALRTKPRGGVPRGDSVEVRESVEGLERRGK